MHAIPFLVQLTHNTLSLQISLRSIVIFSSHLHLGLSNKLTEIAPRKPRRDVCSPPFVSHVPPISSPWFSQPKILEENMTSRSPAVQETWSPGWLVAAEWHRKWVAQLQEEVSSCRQGLLGKERPGPVRWRTLQHTWHKPPSSPAVLPSPLQTQNSFHTPAHCM